MVSMQFSLHYFMGSVSIMKQWMSVVSDTLKPGGLWICTIPDYHGEMAPLISEYSKNMSRTLTKPTKNTILWQNSVCRISEPPTRSVPTTTPTQETASQGSQGSASQVTVDTNAPTATMNNLTDDDILSLLNDTSHHNAASGDNKESSKTRESPDFKGDKNETTNPWLAYSFYLKGSVPDVVEYAVPIHWLKKFAEKMYGLKLISTESFKKYTDNNTISNKIQLTNDEKQVFSFYKCLTFQKQ